MGTGLAVMLSTVASTDPPITCHHHHFRAQMLVTVPNHPGSRFPGVERD